DRARQVTLHSLLSREHIAGHYGGRDFGLAADHLAQADRLMADRPDDPARVLVLGRLAVTQFGALRVADSIAAAESARALGARLGDEGAAEVSTAVAYGSSTALAGRVDRALEIFEQGIRRAEATGAVLGEEQIRMAGVMVAFCLEDPRRGLELAGPMSGERARTAYGRVRMPAYLAGISAMLGDLERGAELLEQLRPEWEHNGGDEFARQPS